MDIAHIAMDRFGMRLSPLLQDHFDNPRRLGTLDGATHMAKGTNPVCGDFMTIALQIEDGRILHARFQAEGCAPTYAAGSILMERTVGVPVSKAETFTVEQLLEWLGELPRAKEHVAHLAIEVLRDALRSPVSGA